MSKRYRILYVEDNIDNQYLLQYYLKNEEFDMVFASNGNQALEQIQKDDFDIFLVDLNLPDGISGDKVVDYIKKNEKTKSQPVIVLTAFTHQDRLDSDIEINADKYVTKPIRKGAFLEVLREYCPAN